ncbi:MAG: RDD family protein [Rhodospirillales bacterium]
MSGSVFVDEVLLTQGVTGRRVGGWFIDLLLMAVVLSALRILLWVAGFITFGLGWFLLGGLWVVPLVYVALFVASPGQATPGQAAVGLRVVRDEDLGRPTPAQALVYAIGYAVTMWAGAIWLLAALFTRRARCLHDIVSGLAVVRADAVPQVAPIWTMAGGYPGR